jgi:hypothetical protein
VARREWGGAAEDNVRATRTGILHALQEQRNLQADVSDF